MLIKYETKIKNTKLTLSKDLKLGYKYVLENKYIRNIILLASLVNIFLCAYNVLIPLYIKNVLKLSGEYYSTLILAEAMGGILVTIVIICLKDIKPNFKNINSAVILLGVSLMSISIFPYKLFVYFVSFSLGLGMAYFNIMFFSYIQITTKKEFMGRVFSVIEMLTMGSVPLAYIIFGYLGEYVLHNMFLL